MAEDEEIFVGERNLPIPATLKTKALITEIYTTYERFQPLAVQNASTPNSTYFVPFYGDKGPANVPIQIKSLKDLKQCFKHEITVDRYGWGAKQASDIISNGGGLVHLLGYNLRPVFGGTFTDDEDPTAPAIDNKPARHAISVLDVCITDNSTTKHIEYRQRTYDPESVTADYNLLSKLGNITAEFTNAAPEIDANTGKTWYPLLILMDANPGSNGNEYGFTITPYSDPLVTDVQMYNINIINAAGVNLLSKVFTFSKHHKYKEKYTFLPYVLEHIDLLHSVYNNNAYEFIMSELRVDEEDKYKIDIFGTGKKSTRVHQNPNDATSPIVNKIVQVMNYVSPEMEAKYGTRAEFDDNSLIVSNTHNPLYLYYGSEGEYVGDNDKDRLLTKLLSAEASLENSDGENVGEYDYVALAFPLRTHFDAIIDHGHYTTEHMELLISLEGMRAENGYGGKGVIRSVCFMNAKGNNETQVRAFLDSIGGGNGIRLPHVKWTHGYSKIEYNGKFEQVSTSYQEGIKQVQIDVNGPFYSAYGESEDDINGMLSGKVPDSNIFVSKNANDVYLTHYGLNLLNKNLDGDVYIANNKSSTTEVDEPTYFFDVVRSLIYMYNNVESIARKYKSPKGLSVGKEQALVDDLDRFFQSVPTDCLASYTVPNLVSVPTEIQNGVYIIYSHLIFRNNAVKFLFDLTVSIADKV